MRQVAALTAVIGFFALAFVGWFTGVPVFICAARAAGGAIAMYVVVGVAGTVVARIIADAAVQAQLDNAGSKEGES